MQQPGDVALIVARPLLVFAKLFKPVLIFLNESGNLFLRLLGREPTSTSHVHSADELRLLVSEARDVGEIGAYTGRILGNVFDTRRTTVRDVMIPREKILAIDRSINPDGILDLLREEGYTRLPVFDGELDNIVGILHTKDLFHLYAKRGAVILADAIRPAVSIGPDTLVIEALRQFRRGRKHLAIVRDEEGLLLGIVTLEDVLEELVGEIEDEHDIPTPAGSD